MSADYEKPLPEVTDENRMFWEGCQAGELRLQACMNCGHIRHLSPACPQCLGFEHEWVAGSGKGTIYSWIVVHQRYNRAFEEELPYNVTIIELDEGPRLITALVGIENDEIKAGTRVEVVFEKISDDITLPKFKMTKA